MKTCLASLVLTAGLSFIPVAAIAQERGGCFMLDSNGQSVDLSALCPGASDSTLPTGLYRVPIKRRVAGIPTVEVTFNSQHTAEMMVDTGASATVISPRLASQLSLEPEGVMVASTPSDRNARFHYTRVASIQVGGAREQDLLVVISPTLSVGLLGQNFFGRYDVTIRETEIEFRVRR